MKESLRTKVCIIGFGKVGRTINSLLQTKDVDISIWNRDQSKLSQPTTLEEALGAARFIFLCIPSAAVREMVDKIEPFLDNQSIVISIAKGIDHKTQQTIDQVLREKIRDEQIALMLGPMLVSDLSIGKRGVGVVGTKNASIGEEIVNLFKDTNLRVEYSSDVRGLTISSVLKNIYALGFGMLDSLVSGENEKGWLVSVAIKEMSLIVDTLGGQKLTVLGTAGLGDLVATSFSQHSRNRKVGEELAKGNFEMLSEGYVAIPAIHSLLIENNLTLPLFEAIRSVAMRDSSAKDVFDKLFYGRDATDNESSVVELVDEVAIAK